MVNKFEMMLADTEKIDVGDDWFEVIKLPKDIYALAENGHVQEVSSFLIAGVKMALLFDTGMGISNISSVARRVTDLEIIVVNSHSHFDHIGDNWRFPAVHIYSDDYAVNNLTEGFSHWELRYDFDPDLFTRDYPVGFDLEKYTIKPVSREKIIKIQDKHIFDLGDRQLEVLHTPGHSQDCIMLIDRENRVLFTGDTYCEWLFAFFGPQLPRFGLSNLDDYENSIKKAALLAPELEYIIPSHGQPLADPQNLNKAAQALEAVNSGDLNYATESLYGDIRRVYDFDELLIWV